MSKKIALITQSSTEELSCETKHVWFQVFFKIFSWIQSEWAQASLEKKDVCLIDLIYTDHQYTPNISQNIKWFEKWKKIHVKYLFVFYPRGSKMICPPHPLGWGGGNLSNLNKKTGFLAVRLIWSSLIYRHCLK